MEKSSELPAGDRAKQTFGDQLPELGGELERAINTLKRLQEITGTLAIEQVDQTAFLDLRSGKDADSTPEKSPRQVAPLVPFASNGQTSRKLAAGESFGRYQIARQLGQGAMGAVYLAYDPQLQRYVALKTPFVGNDPLVVQRFFREARSAAQIRSPYVCPIYEVDNVSGILYLSMAFIEGQTLNQWLRDERRTLQQIVSIFSKVCMGVQKAHAQNIIHRDLKPDNIMVDPDHEPIIMDFGLARRIDDDIQVTVAGGIFGTPSYMSPEQVHGNQDAIGPPSDQYSLGVVLYMMLTGTVPFQGPVMAVLQKVCNEAPVPPSALHSIVGPDSPVERICLKMMAKDQNQRYPSLNEVLTELARFLTPAVESTPPPDRFPIKSLMKKSGRLLAAFTRARPEASVAASAPNPPAPAPSTAKPASSTAKPAAVVAKPQVIEDPGTETDRLTPTICQPADTG